MMGFSIIFPLFPETLKHYMMDPGDPILSTFLNILENTVVSRENSKFIILFGGLVGSVYAILQFLFSPIWGKLSDSFGRKRILEFTSLGSVLGYTVWLFSGSFSTFVLSRVITGTMGGNISVASAAMADLTSEKDRAKGMGFIGAGIGLGFIFGPPIGGLLSGLSLEGWFPGSDSTLTVFGSSALVSVLASTLNLLLVLFFLPETLKIDTANKKKTFRHPVLGIFQSNNRFLPIVSLLYFLFTLGFSGFEFSINFYFSEYLGFSPKEIGLSFLYMGGIVILIQGGIIRRISGKVTERNIALFGAGFLLLGFFFIFLAPSTGWVFFSLFFLSVGSALMNPGLSSLASVTSGAEEQGINLGIMRGFGSLARAFSPFLFSILYFSMGAKFGFGVSFLVISVVFVILMRLGENRSDRI